MNFYKDEKKRIGKGYLGVLSACLACYFLSVQTSVPLRDFRPDNAPPREIAFVNAMFFWSCLILAIYLNEKIFYLKERKEMVYLISKYAIVPLSKKEIYTAKLCIIAKVMGLYSLSCVIIYFALLYVNDYWLLNSAVLLGIGEGFLWIVGLTTLVTAVNIFRGIHLEKNAIH